MRLVPRWRASYRIQAEQQAQNGGGGASGSKSTSTTAPVLGVGGDGSGGGGSGFGNSSPPAPAPNFAGATIIVVSNNKQEFEDLFAKFATPGMQRMQARNSKPLLGR